MRNWRQPIKLNLGMIWCRKQKLCWVVSWDVPAVGSIAMWWCTNLCLVRSSQLFLKSCQLEVS